MFRPSPVSFLQVDIFWGITALFVIAGAYVLLRNLDRPKASSRRLSSTLGVVLQALGCAAAGMGILKPALPWWAPLSIVSTLLVVLLGVSAIALFLSAAVVMGKNWSLVARTRENHELVRNGPFAMVRHPIYLAILLYVIGIAAAFGHWPQLLIAVPLYLAGTYIRIRDEEALLRAQFGEEHARYVRDVPALIPLIV